MAPDNSSKSIKADLDAFLNSLGFELGNPFAAVEANQERKLLPEYFVDVDGYERIKSDKTIVVFAPRGGGKSALRVVLASYSAPTSPKSKSLAIEYTDFAPLITKFGLGEKLSVDDHVNQLLRVGVRTLFFALCGKSIGSNLLETEIQNQIKQKAETVKSILPPVRSRIARWLRTFQPELMETEGLYERLNTLDTLFVPDWADFQESVATQKLRELIIQSSLRENELAIFIADLNDFPAEKINFLLTPTEKMLAFITLTQSVGFTNIQILIDGLDESLETVNDPQAQVNIVEPLVAELHILEMKDVSFKFFLSLAVCRRGQKYGAGKDHNGNKKPWNLVNGVSMKRDHLRNLSKFEPQVR